MNTAAQTTATTITSFIIDYVYTNIMITITKTTLKAEFEVKQFTPPANII